MILWDSGGSAKKSSAYLAGRKWSTSLVDEMSHVILDDFPLPATVPGGQPEFRKLLGLFFF